MQKITLLNRQGFTLIEVLITIFIVGILTGIAIPQYNRSVRRAKMTEALTHGKTMVDSAIRYKSMNGTSPTTFDQLDVGFIGAETEGVNSFNDGNFVYTLAENKIIATNTDPADNYSLHFLFPRITNQGVYAPIACCPDTNWLCKNMGVVSNAPNMINGCLEIK